MAGFKYFRMGEAGRIGITARGTASGVVKISDRPDMENPSLVPVELRGGETETCFGALNIGTGDKALYFQFCGTGTMDFFAFELIKGKL